MEEIDERCRYTYYKLTKYTRIWLDNKPPRESTTREYIKYNDKQRDLLSKQVELIDKVKKVCPDFMYKYPVKGFDLTKYSEVRNVIRNKVAEDLEKER